MSELFPVSPEYGPLPAPLADARRHNHTSAGYTMLTGMVHQRPTVLGLGSIRPARTIIRTWALLSKARQAFRTAWRSLIAGNHS